VNGVSFIIAIPVVVIKKITGLSFDMSGFNFSEIFPIKRVETVHPSRLMVASSGKDSSLVQYTKGTLLLFTPFVVILLIKRFDFP
jgi:hypothetical protein